MVACGADWLHMDVMVCKRFYSTELNTTKLLSLKTSVHKIALWRARLFSGLLGFRRTDTSFPTLLLEHRLLRHCGFIRTLT